MILLVGLAMAQSAVPHQFKGSVTVNGQPAANGLLVTAQIDGVEVGATITQDGGYGAAPYIFYIRDPHSDRAGETITFYVDGVQAATSVFANGHSTTLNLAITKETTNTGGNGGSGGGGGGGGSGGGGGGTTTPADDNESLETGELEVTALAGCAPAWSCSQWLDCVNGVEKRVCADVSDCGTLAGRPAVQRDCEIEEKPEIQGEKGPFSFITGAFIGGAGSPVMIGFVLIIFGLAGYLYFRQRKKK
ncbi:hypothetical protein GOV04_00345 [Candidatus Woesearchaeota archaeon]|nr:hypothetical protein [Candidatus Woesearchaeota archaeon]